jgi:hypothetical protein
MYPQYARVERTTVVTRAMGRGELRAKVIQWRNEAGAKPVATKSVPVKPSRLKRLCKVLLTGENVTLAIMVVASLVIYGAVKAGVL